MATVKFSKVPMNKTFTYNGTRYIKDRSDKAQQYGTQKVRERFAPDDLVEYGMPEITSGLGIAGRGSDDYNIRTESQHAPVIAPDYNRGASTRKCARCGNAANWNAGAGEYLCIRHWDEY